MSASLPTPPVYRKHDSFVGMRHHRLLPDVMARLRLVRERLTGAGLSPYQEGIARAACDEALGEADTPSVVGLQPFTLHSYTVEELSRLDEAQWPRYLVYRYRYDMFPQLRRVDGFPPCLQIEPASVCNYRCVFCFQTDHAFTKRTNDYMGTMSLETFKRVIDQAVGSCEAITLASRGEPLLCRQLPQMLAYARGKFLALKLNTNASQLDEAACHAILEAEVNTIVFSVDAADAITYERLRVGGRFDEVRVNIERFHQIRAKQYPCSRVITRVSGVKVPGTPDLDRMASVWDGLVDQVAFVAYNPWENTYERPVNDLTTPCSDLWRRMFVWWNGTVNPCDVDYRSTLSVGNANEQPLSELWRSEAYMRIREKHLAAQRSQCAPCNRCTVV